jgi:hypothetical protein
MAVAQWYSQKEFYNSATGTAVAGKETEATEYIQVVYQDTESVGFGIVAPYVVGWYCPKASTDPAVIMTQVKDSGTVSADTLT